MILTTHFLFPIVLLLTVQGIFSNLCESDRYSSPLGNYYRLLGSLESYDIWASRCQALGTGWNVASFETSDEEKFVEQIHIHAYDQRAYWIGGTSNSAPGSSISSGVSLPDNETYHVHTGTHFGGLDIYTIDASSSLNGILCEQAKEDRTNFTFSSSTSYYHKLYSHTFSSFDDWSCMCGKVLGAGWSPAVLEIFREIDFLWEVQERGGFLSDFQPYYISGTVDLNERGFPNHFNPTPSGSNPVKVTPITEDFEEVEPSTMLLGILCEKAKL